MGDDKERLERQVKEITEKLHVRDEAERKKAEQEWRKAMDRDTAGHMLKMFQYAEARFADLQAQFDASNPIVAMLRGLNARLTAIENAISAAPFDRIKKPEERA